MFETKNKSRSHLVRLLTASIAVALAMPSPAAAQLSVAAARQMARDASPSVVAARSALEAATALERQAGAWTNPTFGYTREQTGDNSQHIAALEQRIELGGQRAGRIAAARLRREAAQARLDMTQAATDLEVSRAFASVQAADWRAVLAATTASQFTIASAAMNKRLEEGDVSAYEARRVHLESARYQALAAEAALASDDGRARLRSLIGSRGDTALALAPTDAVESALTPDSAVTLALLRNPELRAAALDASAAEADAALATKERIPSPSISGGVKRERSSVAAGGSGFVFGFSLPLPVLDRRAGTINALHAEARRLAAERDVVARRVAQETMSAALSVRRLNAQVAALRAVLGAESAAALSAAETAYTEGEITLIEWLDAVRAYQEAEYAFASIVSQAFTQRAALERLLGGARIE